MKYAIVILLVTAACGGREPDFRIGPTAFEIHDCAVVWPNMKRDLLRLQAASDVPVEVFDVTVAIMPPSTQIADDPHAIGYYEHGAEFIAVGYPTTGVLVHELAHRWDYVLGRNKGEDVHGPRFQELLQKLRAHIVGIVDFGYAQSDFWDARAAGQRGECVPTVKTREDIRH